MVYWGVCEWPLRKGDGRINLPAGPTGIFAGGYHEKNDERDETQLNLKPGEIHVEGDLLVFDSQKAREIYYNPPNLTGCPFEFSSL